MGNAFAATSTDSLAQAKQLLNTYRKTNLKVGACVQGKSLSYDATLTHDDVADAFSIIPPEDFNGDVLAEIAVQNRKAVAEDPNNALLAGMTDQEKEIWTQAVNDCSTQIDFEASGGAEGRAKVEEAQRAALASPEVQAASRVYVACMSGAGFTVSLDPYVAPPGIAQGEHGTSEEELALVERYNSAWQICAPPWQQAFDQKLFG
ncbi:hypothetical protein [Actinoplanes sp. NPDC049118]|uniref:hypothetical protein n=1 Tax=Actinoplanes sp. NPDC049118 TaxID=3155769 RepID=UPI0033C42D90